MGCRMIRLPNLFSSVVTSVLPCGSSCTCRIKNDIDKSAGLCRRSLCTRIHSNHVVLTETMYFTM